jgi:hypothetical protein
LHAVKCAKKERKENGSKSKREKVKRKRERGEEEKRDFQCPSFFKLKRRTRSEGRKEREKILLSDGSVHKK